MLTGKQEMASSILNICFIACFFFQVIPASSITRFLLFTPGAQSPELISAKNPGTTFDPKLKLSVIIHGYLQNGGKNWIKSMHMELMQRQKMNILVVDWGQGSVVTYDTAVQNTRIVGSATAKLIAALSRRHTYDVSNVHVIGHSLGAHIAGYVGADVHAWSNQGQKLGRITGLDPASPNFNHNNTKYRLDHSDALFVDVIHTDIGLGGLGLARPCGHVDFYPNGGDNQPGCALSGDLTAFHPGNLMSSVFGNPNNSPPLAWQVACDHMQVLSLFTSSINKNCSRLSSPCGSWQEFSQGRCSKCNGSCAEMGYNADQSYHREMGSEKKYYLKTTNGHPFCGVTIRVYRIKLSGLSLKGYSFFGDSCEIKVTLTGQSGLTIASKKRDVDKYTRQLELTIFSHVDPGTLISMTIIYEGNRALYVGRATILGPENKYVGHYNKKLLSSSSFFSLFNHSRSFTTSLQIA